LIGGEAKYRFKLGTKRGGKETERGEEQKPKKKFTIRNLIK